VPARSENALTIGLSDIGPVARVRGAVRAATWRTGKLERWDPRGAAWGGSTRARRCPECPRGAHSRGGHGGPQGTMECDNIVRRCATLERVEFHRDKIFDADPGRKARKSEG
jgi:hypothetical protein